VNQPLWQWTASRIAEAVAAGDVHPGDVVESVRQRMDAVEPVLHAFCTPMLEAAFTRADELAAARRRGELLGPLAGVPVAIKDLIPTLGTRTSSGSVAYRDFVSEEDDVAVERLRAAGAIVVGMTNASEFGYRATGVNLLYPPTANPWDPSRTPGGSSAGSAAAVAAGGGSIRIPASFCGTFGVKPSMGRVPLYPGCRDERYPGLSSWESLEHLGPLTRTVADAALVLSVIAGPDPRDRHSIPGSDVDWLAAASLSTADHGPAGDFVVGYSPDLGHAQVDPDVLDVIEQALAAAGRSGLTIRPLNLDWPDAMGTFQALVALDSDLTGLRRLVAAHPGQISDAVTELVAQHWTAEDFTDAVRQRKAACNRMWRLMREVDVLVTPTVAVTAFDRGLAGPPSIAGVGVNPQAWSPFTYFANLTGQPAASVNAGFTASGLPVGLQVIGRHLADSTVLSLCRRFEQIFGVVDRRPPL
jgi:aspartyl-tRNA(Asn)/glutamyl-tRNA(Gln) amidotransferase subunit A